MLRWHQLSLASFFLITALHVHGQSDPMAAARDAYNKRDFGNAVKLLEPLIAEGNIEAMVLMGRMRLAGQGVLKDESMALDFFKKGVEADNAEAIFLFARQMHQGNGLPRDERQAVALYLKAADMGNADAQFWYAVSLYRGMGMTADKAASVPWFQRAADQGQPSAQNWVGLLHDTGEGVEKSPYEAIKWYRKAAQQFEPNGQFNLGVRYATGQGVARDDAEAFKWLLSAAYLRDLSALAWVASFYENGRAVVADPVAAYMWYTLHLTREPANATSKAALTRLAEKLTPAQITEAQNRARGWPAPAELLRAIAATGLQGSTSARNPVAVARPAPAPPRSGSGFVVGAPLRYVVTNFHVVKGCQSLRVMPQSLPATVRAKDERNDLALLDVPNLGLPALKLRTGRGVRPGDELITLGFPLAGLLAAGPSVTTGTLTNLGGILNDTSRFQISAPIQPGNSGGPVLDAYGQVVGVVFGQLNANALNQVTGSLPQNVNFAINTSTLSGFLDASNIDHDLTQHHQDPKFKKMTSAAVGAMASKSTAQVMCVNQP